MPPSLAGWHLDKKVPITIIGALIAQTVFFTAWGTSKYDEVNSRITALERSDSTQQSHETRITRIEENMTYIRSDLQEIKNLLKRQIPGKPQP